MVGILTKAPGAATMHSDFADLSPVVGTRGIPVHHIRNINDAESLRLLKGMAPDLLFVFGWSQIIGEEVRAIPRGGVIGAHPALLPRNRGRHPIVWALVEGLRSTGLTFFYIDSGVDSGDIIWQGECDIADEDDAGALYRKIESLAVSGIREFLPHLLQGTAKRRPQDHSQATYWRKRTHADGEINWHAPTAVTVNLIRGLARPYVGAHTTDGDTVFRIWRAQESTRCRPEVPPGTVTEVDAAGVDVRTGDGVVTLVELDDPVRSRLRPGRQLGSV